MKVYILHHSRSKQYHFAYGKPLDPHCPVAARIIYGEVSAMALEEREASRQGYIPCRVCSRKYEKDRKRASESMIKLVGLGLIGLLWLIDLISDWLGF